MDARRITEEVQSLVINPDDLIYIDSVTNGSRVITYADLCSAVAVTLGIAAIKTTADGAMQISTYDSNRDGIVDNAAALQGHGASYFATASSVTGLSQTVAGKMNTATYDADGDGVVDNAAKVNNHTVHSDVPAQAQFTDTIYDDSGIKASIGDLDNLVTEAKDNLVNAINEAAQSGGSAGEELGLTVANGKLCAVYGT